MTSPRNWWNAENLDEEKRWEALTLFLKTSYNILNRGIIFTDNVRGNLLTIEFDGADTNKAVEHRLSYTPTSYIVFSASAAMTLYDGDFQNDKEFIYLKSNAVGTARVFIF